MEKVENLGRRNLFRGRVSKENVLRLPWVISEEVFTSNCDQCQDCISVCETNIITRDSNGYPKVDFSKGECTFCNKCNEVCEKPLFHQNKESNPWPATISLLDKCLAKNQVFCQSCQDVCETRAIKFGFVDTSIPQPNLNLDDCTSCGACIEVCPQSAIQFVDKEKRVYA